MGLQLSSPYAGVRGQVPVIVRRHQQIPSAARAVESYGSDISLCWRELTINGASYKTPPCRPWGNTRGRQSNRLGLFRLLGYID
jgi:hypothetical protein